MTPLAHQGATLVALGPHVSPSQIATWQGCPRKWSYSRIRERSENRFAQFGTVTHGHLEAYEERGIVPDPSRPEGACALAALPLIPQPQTPGVVVEHAFAFITDGSTLVLADLVGPKQATCGQSQAIGRDDPEALSNAARTEAARLGEPWVAYVGRIDLLDGYDPHVRVRITDYKTCGDLVRAEEMRAAFEEDAQRIVYAAYVVWRFRVANALTRWIYLRRPVGKVGPKAEPVEAIEGVGGIMARLSRLHRTYTLPIVRARGRHPTELPRNTKHCGAYGGCPYRDECWATMSLDERAAALLENAKMTQGPDLMAALSASLGQPAQTQQPAYAPAQPAMSFAPPQQPVAAPVDPRASWSEQDHMAFATIQNPPPGHTSDTVAAYIEQTHADKAHVVAFWRSVSSGVASVQQPVVAPQVSAPPVVAPQGPATGGAPRKPRASFKRADVENMLRMAYAMPQCTTPQDIEAAVARALG